MISHTWCSPPGVRGTPQSRGGGCPPRPALADGLRLFESSLCCLFESESLVKFPHGVPYPVFPRPYPQFGMEVASRPGGLSSPPYSFKGGLRSPPAPGCPPLWAPPGWRLHSDTPTRMPTLVDIPRMEVAFVRQKEDVPV